MTAMPSCCRLRQPGQHRVMLSDASSHQSDLTRYIFSETKRPKTWW